MGKQILFHMLRDDCEELIKFVQERDPVIIVPFDSQTSELHDVKLPCDYSESLCFWNQSLLQSLQYKYIPDSKRGPYYKFDSRLPILEFTRSIAIEWNGRQALLQGRIYSPFEGQRDDLHKLEKWYGTLVRWIRKNWIRNPVPLLGGYVAPAAFTAYEKGLTLMPMFIPPLTPQWISWNVAQDGLRNSL
jgi:hypothetical protein